MAIVVGGLARINLDEYDRRRTSIILGSQNLRHHDVEVLDAVRAAGGVSIGTIVRKWTVEETVTSGIGRWSGTHLQVSTYVELSWPEGYCQKCPIDILLDV